jgi:hypothetical protein
MMESLLRQHNAFKVFTTTDQTHSGKFTNIKLTEHDWVLIQEFEAIMREMGVINIGVQSDQVGYISFCWYQIFQVCFWAESACSFKVMNFNKEWKPDAKTSSIPLIDRPRHSLPEEAQQLLKRLVVEFDNYLPFPDSDMRMALYFNPVATITALQ